MVGRVLHGNGITELLQGRYRLIGSEELSEGEPDELLQVCHQRVDAFRAKRGEEVFAHRSHHRMPISGSIKVRVLTRARVRCECCGAWILLGLQGTNGPWRWTPSSPRRSLPRSGRTKAARTLSAT